MALVRQLQKHQLMPKAAHLPTGLSFQSALFLFFFSTFHLDIYTRSDVARLRPRRSILQVCTTTSLTQVRLLQHALELMQVYVPVAVGVVLLEHLLDLVVVVPGIRERLEELFLVQ